MTRTPRSMLFAAAAALALSLQPADAQTHSPFDSALSKRTKSVGVLVATGYQAQVVTLGALLNFGTQDITVTRDDGLLADRVYEQVKAELDLEQRYDVRRIEISPAKARQLVQALWNRREDRFGTWPADIKDLVASCQCDAVLMLADGPGHNTMIEAGLTFGPAFVGKAGVLGGKDVARAHVRVGLLALLVDPQTGKRVTTGRADERPDYRSDVATYWPGGEGNVSEAHWQRMALYLDGAKPVYRQALAQVGLRPTCAHQYTMAPNTSRSGEAPPPPPADEATKCPPLREAVAAR